MATAKEKSQMSVRAELRRKAEKQLKTTLPEACFFHGEDETRRLVHELEVHQIELEMQNAELRHARYEMETALEKFTDLYEFAPVGYFTLDQNGVINAVNLAGASLVGGVRSTLIGRHFGQLVAAEYRSVFTGFLGEVLTCQIKESCEVALTNGGSQPVIVQIEAMSTASGQEFRLALVDITERRRIGDALIEKQWELEELNTALDTRIDQAVDELRRKDRILILQGRRAALGEMIGNIAHQWRQPLNVLGLYLQELPLAYGTAEFNRAYLEDSIGKSMQLVIHMSRTIDDFRDFFKVDKEKVLFNVNQVIGRALTLIEESFQSQHVCVEIRSECDSLVDGYPNEYAQVIVNILMNARDALVGRAIDNALITIRSFLDGGKTVVTVTDNGAGIAEEIIDKIFDPYFTTKGPDKGTGIGLFMSKTIIEKNMGGKLTVRNVGNGAEFRVEV